MCRPTCILDISSRGKNTTLDIIVNIIDGCITKRTHIVGGLYTRTSRKLCNKTVLSEKERINFGYSVTL